jgi:hypothetical protein
VKLLGEIRMDRWQCASNHALDQMPGKTPRRFAVMSVAGAGQRKRWASKSMKAETPKPL